MRVPSWLLTRRQKQRQWQRKHQYQMERLKSYIAAYEATRTRSERLMDEILESVYREYNERLYKLAEETEEE